MVYAVFESKRKSGKKCEWYLEMKDELFRLDIKELEQRCLKAINKANVHFWDKFVSCRYKCKTIL